MKRYKNVDSSTFISVLMKIQGSKKALEEGEIEEARLEKPKVC